MDDIREDMTIILCDEQKLEYICKNDGYVESIFRTKEDVKKLLTYFYWKGFIPSYIFQTAGCAEEDSMYVSKAAANLIQHFPECLKEIMLEDEEIMNQIYGLLDDEHFSPQYAI